MAPKLIILTPYCLYISVQLIAVHTGAHAATAASCSPVRSGLKDCSGLALPVNRRAGGDSSGGIKAIGFQGHLSHQYLPNSWYEEWFQGQLHLPSSWPEHVHSSSGVDSGLKLRCTPVTKVGYGDGDGHVNHCIAPGPGKGCESPVLLCSFLVYGARSAAGLIS